jgi:hypothetical protein
VSELREQLAQTTAYLRQELLNAGTKVLAYEYKSTNTDAGLLTAEKAAQLREAMEQRHAQVLSLLALLVQKYKC